MTSAQDAEDRMAQLLTLTERLTERLAAEAVAFETRRSQDGVGWTEETSRLANIYRHETARLKGDPALVAAASLVSRQTLVRATSAFEAVLARHARALAAAKTVTEGLVHAIAQEVAASRSARAPYGPDARSPSADATAITLNQRA